jgi:hypothetical protein
VTTFENKLTIERIKMNYHPERRHTERFNISGAQILYQTEDGKAALTG